MGSFLDRWFNNNKNDAVIRHEFPMYNITDELDPVEEEQSPLVSNAQMLVDPRIEMEENMMSHRK